MRNKLADWRKELKTAARFKSFYNYVFEYLREEKKIISIEEAKTVWEMLKMPERWSMFPKFIAFAETKTKAINR